MKTFKRWALRALIALAILIVAVLAAPYLIPIEGYTGPPEVPPFPESSITDVDGVFLHSRYFAPEGDDVQGNVALIHGFCGSTFSYRKQFEPLTSIGYRVCAIDLPAFGYSDRRPGINHSATARSDYVWTVLEETAKLNNFDPAEPWVIVGHSMGGGVISAMAQREPDRTAGLIFVDGGSYRGSGGDSDRSARSRRGGGITAALMGFGPVRRWVEVYATYVAFQQDNIHKLLTSAFGQEPDAEAVKGYLDALRVPRTASAILDQFRNRHDTASYDASAIEAPTLIIWGSNDEWVPIESGRRLNEAIEGSVMHVIEGAGHNPMETHPVPFNTVMITFLQVNFGEEEFEELEATDSLLP